jgi:hypothetical protein
MADTTTTGTTQTAGSTQAGTTAAAASTAAASTTAATGATQTGTQTGAQQTGAAQQTTQTTDTAARTTLAATTDGAVATPADWPADWREKLAAGDEKKLTTLKRYASPQAYADAGFQLRQMMDSKQLRAPSPPADAKPEDVALWRKDNGIPEKPEGYVATLDKGLVIGEADKPLVGKFLENMHARNASPEVVNAALGTYYQIQETLQTQQIETDNRVRQAAEDALRPEWGPEYRRNINVINGYLDTAPKGVKESIMNARVGGKPIASDPDVLRFLLSAAIQNNPAATVAPGSTGSSQQTIDARIGEIEKTMRENRGEYNRNSGMQAEYLKLLGAREALQKRSAA